MEAATRTAPVETRNVRLGFGPFGAREWRKRWSGGRGVGEVRRRRRGATGAARNGEGAGRNGDPMGLARGGPRPLVRGCSTEMGAAARRAWLRIRTTSAARATLDIASGAFAPPRNGRGAPAL